MTILGMAGAGIPVLTGPGFIVEDLGLATGGKHTYSEFFTVDPAVEPNSGVTKDVLGERHGIDLYFKGDAEILS